ncbi:interphotoreceptor matrix proteoglycan 2 [Scleropages formosus]|uniref:interphotoreceptor matrix proteoglycan 2 n=1 Tax=Scleropages formosus TaxID=113540 RepID=UPI0008787AD8|nr:interphotoreceptor matrix proteoglycan 2-like [Scleropages formosus]
MSATVEGLTEDTGAIPTRKVNISLRISKDFDSSFENLNSSLSKKLIRTLIHKLKILCNSADPQNFKDAEVIGLRRGSVIADCVAEYTYPNNEGQITFLNTNLEPTLQRIFNNSDNLKHLTQDLGGTAVEVTKISLQPTLIKNIEDLKPFLACTLDFANYTMEVISGSWQCLGLCRKDPNYCHQHGDCFNVKTGPICKCFGSDLEQYYGEQCQLYRRAAGFYGVLFGVLIAGLLFLLILISVVVIFCKRRYEQR